MDYLTQMLTLNLPQSAPLAIPLAVPRLPSRYEPSSPDAGHEGSPEPNVPIWGEQAKDASAKEGIHSLLKQRQREIPDDPPPDRRQPDEGHQRLRSWVENKIILPDAGSPAIKPGQADNGPARTPPDSVLQPPANRNTQLEERSQPVNPPIRSEREERFRPALNPDPTPPAQMTRLVTRREEPLKPTQLARDQSEQNFETGHKMIGPNPQWYPNPRHRDPDAPGGQNGRTQPTRQNPSAQVSEPVIQITIGRIEVKGVPASNSTPRQSRSSAPVMSLEEYLRQAAKKGGE